MYVCVWYSYTYGDTFFTLSLRGHIVLVISAEEEGVLRSEIQFGVRIQIRARLE